MECCSCFKKGRHAGVTLLVGPCGHTLCLECKTQMFDYTDQKSCPACRATLFKDEFVELTREDMLLDREKSMRKAVLQEFNMRRDNFESENDFNTYLEEREDIIYNLTHDIDVDATKKRIEAYRAKHRRAIAENQARAAEEAAATKKRLLEIERQEAERRRQRQEEDELEAKAKESKKKRMMDDIVAGKVRIKLKAQPIEPDAPAAAAASAAAAPAAATAAPADAAKAVTYQPQMPMGFGLQKPLAQRGAVDHPVLRDTYKEQGDLPFAECSEAYRSVPVAAMRALGEAMDALFVT